MRELYIVVEIEEMRKIISDEYLMGEIYDGALCLGSGEEIRIYKSLIGDNEVIIIAQPIDISE